VLKRLCYALFPPSYLTFCKFFYFLRFITPMHSSSRCMRSPGRIQGNPQVNLRPLWVQSDNNNKDISNVHGIPTLRPMSLSKYAMRHVEGFRPMPSDSAPRCGVNLEPRRSCRHYSCWYHPPPSVPRFFHLPARLPQRYPKDPPTMSKYSALSPSQEFLRSGPGFPRWAIPA